LLDQLQTADVGVEIAAAHDTVTSTCTIPVAAAKGRDGRTSRRVDSPCIARPPRIGGGVIRGTVELWSVDHAPIVGAFVVHAARAAACDADDHDGAAAAQMRA
jgi:hypothetical protein